jgi:hypothetical protein
MSNTLFGDDVDLPPQLIKVKFRNQTDIDALSKRVGVTLVTSIETVKIPGLFTTKNFNTPRPKREPRPKKWEAYWIDMPEYDCGRADPYHSVVFLIEMSHIKEMADTLEQKISDKTKSIWYPKLEIGLNSGKRYVDES